jgi:phage terminase large subunit-like protein
MLSSSFLRAGVRGLLAVMLLAALAPMVSRALASTQVAGDWVEVCSAQGTPAQWAGAVLKAYAQHGADRIIAERNNGGEMVEHTLRSVGGADVSITTVWASRGKATRAEPISALYEQGRVHHVGGLPILEDQLCSWVPGDASPDRLDALVWALTELFPNAGAPPPRRSTTTEETWW